LASPATIGQVLRAHGAQNLHSSEIIRRGDARQA
jgi:hypothetical protein